MKIRKPGYFAVNLSVAAMLLAGPVMAATKPAKAPPAQKMEDRGAEVVMTRAEAKTRAETAFDKLDANHDGKLDKADREARHLARINAHFDALDTNHDGSISRDEFLAAHTGPKGPEMGGGMEHDMGAPGERPDGPPPHGRMGPHRAPKDGPHGRGGPDGPPDGLMAEGMMLMEVGKLADPQHTGTVTRQAFVDAALKLFDEADANHDGKLTRAERRAAFMQHHPRMGRHFGHGGPEGGPGAPRGNMGGDDMPPPPPPPAHQN